MLLIFGKKSQRNEQKKVEICEKGIYNHAVMLNPCYFAVYMDVSMWSTR